MSDRVVRAGILTSDAINSLSWAAEVFYRRLMSVVDDFGRYDGREQILRSQLYALKADKVSGPDVVKWMGECSKAGLVRRYTVDSKAYIEISKFGKGQRLRANKSKWPEPPPSNGCHPPADVIHLPTSDSHPLTDDGHPPSNGCHPLTSVSETETDAETDTDPPNPHGGLALEVEVLEYLNQKTGSKFRPMNGSLVHIKARLDEGITVEQMKKVVDARVKAWSNDSKMKEFLRPQTLFNSTKFSGYLGQAESEPKVDEEGGW